MKNTKMVHVLLVIGICAILGFYLFTKPTDQSTEQADNAPTVAEVQPTPVILPADDPLNATYTIEGEQITFTDGLHEQSIPDSEMTIVTRVWNPVPATGDLDGDGVDDFGLLLTQEPGGSGTFFYVTASMNKDDMYVGTNAILIGDRIAPQNLLIDEGVIVVNYADRPEGAAMSEDPSIGMTKRFVVEDMVLREAEEGV